MTKSNNTIAVQNLRTLCVSIYTYMQLIAEFDRVVEQQNASFLAVKLRWLELVPRILEAGRSEGNESIAHWLHQRSESSDEGLFKKTMYKYAYSISL